MKSPLRSTSASRRRKSNSKRRGLLESVRRYAVHHAGSADGTDSEQLCFALVGRGSDCPKICRRFAAVSPGADLEALRPSAETQHHGKLGDYEKIVVSDGYSGYNKLNKIVRAGCWAHMQRKWREAMPKGEIGEKSTAAQGYRYCNRLFAVERKLADLSDEERLAKRREKSQPIVEAYYKWIETLTRPSGKLKDAITSRNGKGQSPQPGNLPPPPPDHPAAAPSQRSRMRHRRPASLVSPHAKPIQDGRMLSGYETMEESTDKNKKAEEFELARLDGV